MKLIFVICVTLILNIYCVHAEKARYDNYRLYSLTVDNEEQLDFLEKTKEMLGDYSFWNEPAINGDVDIMVPPHKIDDFRVLVEAIQAHSKLKVENVQKLIEDEQSVVMARSNTWASYGTYEQIYEWLDSMIAKYPTKLTNYDIGYSYEKRLMRAVRLSHKAGNPAIFIEANIHAREWISSATATWILNHLLTSSDPNILDIAENIDWYFIPIANVDGYVYTHTTNRMWRKTRQPHGSCVGADPNRNFAFQWMKGGASNNPCSQDYAGPAAWSEPETANIRNFVTELGSSIKIYLSFHAYGQYLLMPYGHTKEPAPNNEDLMSIAKATVDAISKRSGTTYRYGPVSKLMYIASGSSADWAYGSAKIPISYTFELRDRGSHGFMLPPLEIIPNAQEVLDGIVAAIQQARKLGHI